MAKTKTKATEVQAIDANTELIASLDATIAELHAKMADMEQAHKAEIETLSAECDKLRLKALTSVHHIERMASDRVKQIFSEKSLEVSETREEFASKRKLNVIDKTTTDRYDASKLPMEYQPPAHYCAKLQKDAAKLAKDFAGWGTRAKATK